MGYVVSGSTVLGMGAGNSKGVRAGMEQRFRMRLSVLFGLGLLAGCAGSGPVGLDPGIKVSQLSELPKPTSQDIGASRPEYFVGTGDKLSVDVFGVADLTRSVVTDSQGNFSFPLIGSVKGAGRTPNDIAAEIENRLRGRYVLNPQVSITLSEAASQMVTVGGQVRAPGQFPAAASNTLVRAVAIAGGGAEFAKFNDVLIFRTVAGQKYVGIYDLASIQRGNAPDPDVFSNDVIIVGDNASGRLFQDLLKILPSALSAALIVTQARR